eukprot:344948_1
MSQIKKTGDMVKQIDKGNYIKQLGFIVVMKWNVALTTITVASSAITLFMIPFADHLIWIFCLGDPLVNSLCIFFMHGANRKFMSRVLCCCCSVRGTTLTMNSSDINASAKHSISPPVLSPDIVPDNKTKTDVPKIEVK